MVAGVLLLAGLVAGNWVTLKEASTWIPPKGPPERWDAVVCIAAHLPGAAAFFATLPDDLQVVPALRLRDTATGAIHELAATKSGRVMLSSPEAGVWHAGLVTPGGESWYADMQTANGICIDASVRVSSVVVGCGHGCPSLYNMPTSGNCRRLEGAWEEAPPAPVEIEPGRKCPCFWYDVCGECEVSHSLNVTYLCECPGGGGCCPEHRSTDPPGTAPPCTCLPAFSGAACGECAPDFAGANCTDCVAGKMGRACESAQVCVAADFGDIGGVVRTCTMALGMTDDGVKISYESPSEHFSFIVGSWVWDEGPWTRTKCAEFSIQPGGTPPHGGATVQFSAQSDEQACTPQADVDLSSSQLIACAECTLKLPPPTESAGHTSIPSRAADVEHGSVAGGEGGIAHTGVVSLRSDVMLLFFILVAGIASGKMVASVARRKRAERASEPVTLPLSETASSADTPVPEVTCTAPVRPRLRPIGPGTVLDDFDPASAAFNESTVVC